MVENLAPFDFQGKRIMPASTEIAPVSALTANGNVFAGAHRDMGTFDRANIDTRLSTGLDVPSPSTGAETTSIKNHSFAALSRFTMRDDNAELTSISSFIFLTAIIGEPDVPNFQRAIVPRQDALQLNQRRNFKCKSSAKTKSSGLSVDWIRGYT